MGRTKATSVDIRREELKAWGFALRVLESALSEGGEGMDSMVDGMFETPRETFPAAVRQVVRRGDVDDADKELLSLLLADVSFEDDYGTRGNKISPNDQGVVALAYCRFDRKMMTVESAAEELGVSKAWVYRIMKNDPMSYAVVAGKKMMFARDVERVKKSREEIFDKADAGE